MSPEQCMGMPLDIRSDIYSMGCLMYESLTGERPAQSESPLATMYKQINDAPLQLHERRAALSKERQLEMVVLKAIAKRPEDRYSSFAELRSALMYSVLLPFK